MATLTFAGLAILLALPSAPQQAPVDAATFLFAPPPCGYSVAFPVRAPLSETTTDNGTQSFSADLVRNGVRLAAACIASAEVAPLAAPDNVTARMEQMAAALGVRNTAFRRPENVGPDCGEITGDLGSASSLFRIEARLCVSARAMFIAEAVYPAGRDDSSARSFLDSISAK